MSIYFTDKVTITPLTKDPTFNTITEGTPVLNVKARVEFDSEVRYSANGKPIAPEVWVFLPFGTSITRGDKINVTKLHGRTPTDQEAIDLLVRKSYSAGSFSDSHIEVLC